MPYIDPNVRKQFDEYLDKLPALITKGNLEYCIFKLMMKMKKERKWCYSDLHDICYSAHHCGDEFKRRFLDKRENEAREKNGDII